LNEVVIKKQSSNKQQVVDRFLPMSEGLFMREIRYGIRSVYFRTGVKDVLARFGAIATAAVVAHPP
jgi:hypothetical protein